MDANHVLQRAAHEEILLLQAQCLALGHLVVRIKHLGDVLRLHLVGNCAVVVAVVKGTEIKRFHCLGFPKTEYVARAYTVAEDWRVISFALDLSIGHPADTISSMFVSGRLGVTTEFYLVVDLRADNLPGIAIAQPLVRHLDLPAVLDCLLKDAKLVTDAIADGGYFDGGERVHKA